MRLNRNQVYKRTFSEGKSETLRVIDIGHSEVRLVRVEGYPGTWISLTIHQVNDSKWEETDDPHAPLRATADNELSPFQCQTRDRAYAAIQLLHRKARLEAEARRLATYECLFIHHDRIRLCKEVGEELKTAPNTICRWLLRWWQRGMTRNACLPDVEKMSGKGGCRAVPREACDSTGWPLDPSLHKRIGRAPKTQGRRGIRMTVPIRENILTQGKKLYIDHPNFSIRDAFILWKDQNALPEGRSPTPVAFSKILTRDEEVEKAISRRHLLGRPSKRKPPIRETMHTRVPGPGFRTQMDASPLPVQILNEVTGEIGPNATLFWGLDTYVKGITGFEVSAKPECALTAQITFYNCTRDKVPYCAELGRKIDRSEWPMQGIPEDVVFDRGPFMGPVANLIVDVFGVTIDNTPAYSPQLKADVEAAFGSLMRKVFTKLDDYSPPRAGRKFDGDGNFPPLTLSEIRILVLLFVFEYNSRPLDRLPSPSEAHRKVPITPIGMWNREFDRLNGSGKVISPEDALLAFTQPGEARIHRRGIDFEGLLYVCTANGVEEFQTKLGDRRRPLKIRYDEGNTGRVFVQYRTLSKLGVRLGAVKPHAFHECTLHSDKMDWAGYTFAARREALAAHSTVMQDAHDTHDRNSAALLKEVIAAKQHSQLAGTSPAVSDKSKSKVTEAIEAAEVDRRIVAEAPTTPKPGPNVSATSNPSPPLFVASKNLQALRAARQNQQNINP